MNTRSDFKDSANWDQLADRYLSRYVLPDWSVKCSADKMDLWVDRCGLSKSEYMDYTATGFEDWIALNPAWPLRAFIGLILEYRSTS